MAATSPAAFDQIESALGSVSRPIVIVAIGATITHEHPSSSADRWQARELVEVATVLPLAGVR